MSRTIYFTTPLYYVNAKPHIGHMCTTTFVDAMTRFHRMMGDDAYFLTGTDEHGEKIAEAAKKSGVKPQKFVDDISNIFSTTWKSINIKYDDFIKTTEERHKLFVRNILQKVHDSGDIYFDEYEGLYCLGCERYLNKTDLVDDMCPDHQKKPKIVKESNYFFKMSKYKDKLLAHINENPDWIYPERYRNEVISFLKNPLEDLCISRPKTRLTWGIELPFDDKYVTYVWFDALCNYVSALHKDPAGNNIYKKYWPFANHVIGKDILKTHAIYWPTMLMAANIPLFKRLDVHGHWLMGESKMSKSLGNVVKPMSFDKRFGIENLKYFFFREMKFGSDSGFTYELFIERYNSDLANGLGNLLSRSASIVKKNLDGIIPPDTTVNDGPHQKIINSTKSLAQNYEEFFLTRTFHKLVEAVRNMLSETDKYLNEMKPWLLAKEENKKGELGTVLYTALEAVRIAAVAFSPIMPKKCQEILDFLGEKRLLNKEAPFNEIIAWGGLKSEHELSEVPMLFPRIDKKILDKIKSESDETEKRQVVKDVAPVGEEIDINDFSKIDLRVGVVKEANIVEKADKLIELIVDIGETKPRRIFAGIKKAYPDPQILVGTRVIVLANLKPRKMPFGVSEGMVLASHDKKDSRLGVAKVGDNFMPGDKIT